jgi:hypothetical protein
MIVMISLRAQNHTGLSDVSSVNLLHTCSDIVYQLRHGRECGVFTKRRIKSSSTDRKVENSKNVSSGRVSNIVDRAVDFLQETGQFKVLIYALRSRMLQ